jgi:hypothetical protein
MTDRTNDQEAEHSPPGQADRTTGPAWLTYAQIGEQFGMSPEAVRQRARRLRWRTQPGTETIRQAEAMVDNLREAHAGEVSGTRRAHTGDGAG